jgi:hypothetical protein
VDQLLDYGKRRRRFYSVKWRSAYARLAPEVHTPPPCSHSNDASGKAKDIPALAQFRAFRDLRPPKSKQKWRNEHGGNEMNTKAMN